MEHLVESSAETGNLEQAIERARRREWLIVFPTLMNLEALAAHEGASRAIAVNSCGTALDCCIMALGIGPGENEKPAS